jgi:DNA mismatch repair protein MutL
LRVVDDGEGMTRDDALLAFERHATSKLRSAEDLNAIATLGFRGEALASIASVARVELITRREDSTAATRVQIEGGRIRDVKDAAHPQGTTITVRDLFFNVPARRKFLRSEATESFHLANLVTHYALAHPEITFTLTNNGRESLGATAARDLRERAYQIFGAGFIENLLEVNGGREQVALVRGYVSAPRERRTSRDAQYLFINGRYVRDRLIGRALSEGYRAVLPQGVYPAALLFLEVPLAEVDVNVHPAKTEVRFRRAAAVADAVREAVRGALANAGYIRAGEATEDAEARRTEIASAHQGDEASASAPAPAAGADGSAPGTGDAVGALPSAEHERPPVTRELVPPSRQGSIEFGFSVADDEEPFPEGRKTPEYLRGETARDLDAIMRDALSGAHGPEAAHVRPATPTARESSAQSGPQPGEAEERGPHPDAMEQDAGERAPANVAHQSALPPLVSVANLIREVPVESLDANIRPLGQLADSFILATDDEGLLLIDQHVAHERILFEKYHALEASRPAESQNLLMPETFDLTPAQAAVFEAVADELETYGFGLMRLSGRTVAIKAVPADLEAGDARGILAEVLDTVEAERRGAARQTLRERIAASLACRAAIKVRTPLALEKMRWLIDRLLKTSLPTTCPHGRSVILRLTTRDIEKSFHRS